MPEENGRIKLTWQQVVWGLTLVSVILLTYADLKNTVYNLSIRIDQVYSKADTDLAISSLKQTDRVLLTNIKLINKKLKIETEDE